MIKNADGITSLAYKGSVDLVIKFKGREIFLHRHNAGENDLKKAFAKFLVGMYSKYDIPTYIDLMHTEDDEPSSSSEWESWLRVDPIPISGKKYQQVADTLNWQATFTAALSATYLWEPITVTTPGSFRFYLYSSENTETTPTTPKQKLAWISVSKDDLANLVEGAEAIVYWNMMLLNASEIEQENA